MNICSQGHAYAHRATAVCAARSRAHTRTTATTAPTNVTATTTRPARQRPACATANLGKSFLLLLNKLDFASRFARVVVENYPTGTYYWDIYVLNFIQIRSVVMALLNKKHLSIQTLMTTLYHRLWVSAK